MVCQCRLYTLVWLYYCILAVRCVQENDITNHYEPCNVILVSAAICSHTPPIMWWRRTGVGVYDVTFGETSLLIWWERGDAPLLSHNVSHFLRTRDIESGQNSVSEIFVSVGILLDSVGWRWSCNLVSRLSTRQFMVYWIPPSKCRKRIRSRYFTLCMTRVNQGTFIYHQLRRHLNLWYRSSSK